MIDDFHPTATWQNLRFRAELLRRLRQFFDARGFLEVETPILSADTVVDRHLDPFCVPVASGQWPVVSKSTINNQQSTISNPQSLIPNPSAQRRMWLQTSPEFAMKRLLAAGGEVDLPGCARLPPRRTWPAAQSRVHAGRVVSAGRRIGRRDAVDQRFVRKCIAGPRSRPTRDQLSRGVRALRGHRSAHGRRRRTGRGGPKMRHPTAGEPRAGRSRRLARSVVGRADPAALGRGAAGDRVRLSGQPGGVGPYPAGQSARGRTLRVVRRPASSWPTATTNCSIRPSCGRETRASTPSGWPTASRLCPKKAGSWRRWRPACRRRWAWPWVSTGW